MSNIHKFSLRLVHGHNLCISFSDMGKAQLACLSSPFGVKIRGGKLHLSILHAKWNKISVCSICFGKLGIFMKFCAYRQAVNEFQLELKLVFSYKFLKASLNPDSIQTMSLSTRNHIFGSGNHMFGTRNRIFGTRNHIFGSGNHIFGTRIELWTIRHRCVKSQK